MARLPAVTGPEAIKAFARIGFVEHRIEGSHHILKKPGHKFLLTVPVHGRKTLPPGTLRALIRGAGISVEEFVELLRK